jgi:hypothetical protein
MDIVLFTLVGIFLYLFCDWALRMMERAHGEPLPYRNIVFLVLILTLSLSSFSIIRSFMDAGESPQDNNEEQQSTNR